MHLKEGKRAALPFGRTAISSACFLLFIVIIWLHSSQSGGSQQSQSLRAQLSSILPYTTSQGTGQLILDVDQQQQTKTILRQFLDYRALYSSVYEPAGYTMCKQSSSDSSSQSADSPQCWLPLQKPVGCSSLFEEYLQVLKSHVPVFPAPRKLPAGQEQEFLLGGYVQLSDFYRNEPGHAPGAAVPVWNATLLNPMIQQAKARTSPFGGYNRAVEHLYQALDCHSVEGLTGAVFGSERPWVEAVFFAFGASHLTTIEFRKTITEVTNHQVLQPADWANSWFNGSLPNVDFAVSFSSWEHDGLGRYGDPVHPWGDVKAMQRASCYVKPGGLMFFAAPSSSIDQLQYNAHRIYGPVRLPVLTANWEVLGVYESGRLPGQCGSTTCSGLMEHWGQKAPLGNYEHQPVIVMRNQRTAPCHVSSAV